MIGLINKHWEIEHSIEYYRWVYEYESNVCNNPSFDMDTIYSWFMWILSNATMLMLSRYLEQVRIADTSTAYVLLQVSHSWWIDKSLFRSPINVYIVGYSHESYLRSELLMHQAIARKYLSIVIRTGLDVDCMKTCLAIVPSYQFLCDYNEKICIARKSMMISQITCPFIELGDNTRMIDDHFSIPCFSIER
jgi:hypothetical protein